MIAEFFPEAFQRYISLPVLGPFMDPYAGWLHEQQYTWRSARYELRMAGRVADYLEQRAVCRLEDLNHQHLDDCHRWFRQKFPAEAGSVLVLLRFLHTAGHIDKPSSPPSSNASDVYVEAFMASALARSRLFRTLGATVSAETISIRNVLDLGSDGPSPKPFAIASAEP